MKELKELTNQELIDDLSMEDFEIYTLEEEKENFSKTDEDIIEEMESLGCNILLHNNWMARNWYFTDIDSMCDWFRNGNQVGFDTAGSKLA